MSAVVQATCPGCRNVLRIPADWLHQAIRCKQCGTVLQAKHPVPRPASQTPAPPPRKAPTSKAVRVAPVVQPAPTNGSPFGDLSATDSSPTVRRRRRRGGTWWMGPVIAVAVLLLAGVAAALNWSRIKNILEIDPPAAPSSPAVAITTPPREKDKGAEPVVQPDKPPKSPQPKETKRPSPTTKPAPPKNPTPTTKPAPVKPKPPVKRPDPPPVVTNPPRPDPSKRPAPKASAFPRRALVISIHDYLYANPVRYGMPVGAMHNLKGFIQALGNPDVGLKIPRDQVFHLSDHAPTGARYPTKPVVEHALTSFLETSRPQDRVVVFFVGHAVEIGDEAYLVPIEGELDNAAGLIPLKWVYQQLQACKARQKVLVLDTNRLNPSLGQERPIAGPMGPKLDALLKSPPPGVQVWSACVEKQHSYETDNDPMGVFLDELEATLRKGLANKIQHPQDPLPLEQFVAAVNRGMAAELAPRKLEQVSRLSGAEAAGGAAPDAKELAAKPPDLGPVAVANKGPARAILKEVGVPPIKSGADDTPDALAMLPFSAEMLKKYEDGGAADTPLRQAVRKARAYLYAVAVSPGQPPAELEPEIQKAREALRNVNLSVLKEGYRAPGAGNAENRFKEMVANDGRQVARVMLNLGEVLDELKDAGDKGREAEPKRWQANYDFVLARLQSQIAYLYEYQSMLGQMRKEFPQRDPALHGGWRLAAQASLQGDAAGKKLFKSSQKILEKLAKDNPGTPWEVLAKREKLTALGLEWQPTK